MGIDIWEVIDAAKTKPFGFQAFYPGPGLGGHCIPIDPFYLTWLARKYGLTTRFIELAGEINTLMPRYVVDQDRRGTERLSKVASRKQRVPAGRGLQERRRRSRVRARRFGLWSYSPRAAPVFLTAILTSPSCSKAGITTFPIYRARRSLPSFLAQQDCVVIVTDHSQFDYDFIVRHSKLVIDTRNATRNVVTGREKIRKA